jgi:hypothetical protein
LLPAAGGGGGSGKSDDNSSAIASTAGILLEGDAAALATAALRDFDSGDRTANSEISVDADGARIDRTNIEITFDEAAITGEINTLLDSIGGMLAGVGYGYNRYK